ncbi:GNAT family protein [Streptomyces sp. NPDC046557]|uniref:GNAT family N-acetyltransferase n=1 Tax=Streptomyces sp. NPDC046557 TaxID=3155372 RepID=UPI0033DAB5B6
MPALMPMFRDAEARRLTGSHGGGEPDEARIRTWYDTRGNQDDRLDLAVVEPSTGNVVGERFSARGSPRSARISLEVYAFNPRARRVHEKVGFVAEGVLRDALLRDGERVEAVVMSILAPERLVHRGHPG